MKRVLIGVMCAAGLVSCAMAQSSVTIYGLIDLGPTFYKGGGVSDKRLDSGISFGSRLGFRGNQDLGGGLNGIFDLEMPINANTGEVPGGAAIWGRESWAGLQSNSLGTLALGRQTDFMVDFGIMYSGGTLSEGAFGFHPGGYDRVAGLRYNSSAKYTSPKLGPLRLGALIADSDGTTGRGKSAGAFYDDGAITGSLIYTSTEKQSIDPRNQLGITRLNGAALAGALTTNQVDVMGVGMGYRTPAYAVRLMHTRVDLKLAAGSPTLSTTEVSGKYQVTPASFVGASLAKSKIESNDFRKYYLTFDYQLSKGNNVYVSYTNLKVSDGNRAIMIALPPSTTSTASALHMGYLYRF
jgi:outer membrane protein OmpU